MCDTRVSERVCVCVCVCGLAWVCRCCTCTELGELSSTLNDEVNLCLEELPSQVRANVVQSGRRLCMCWEKYLSEGDAVRVSVCDCCAT